MQGAQIVLWHKRRDHWRDQPHPENKRFTQEEITSEVYGSYKNMALGRTLRLPTRADYSGDQDVVDAFFR